MTNLVDDYRFMGKVIQEKAILLFKIPYFSVYLFIKMSITFLTYKLSRSVMTKRSHNITIIFLFRSNARLGLNAVRL